jgi:hypothetical protein
MFNTTDVPSLAPIIDAKLKEAEIEVVPGKVTDEAGHFFGTISIPTDDFGKMTADEIFLLYLKPLTTAIGDAIVNYAAGYPVCTKARKLPGKKDKVIGFRCFQGKVPVNVYIMRRSSPDRHQIIVDTHVQQVRPDDEQV